MNTTAALPPDAYINPDYLPLEIDELILKRWQFACHVSDLDKPGSFFTVDLGPNSAIIVRDEHDQLRAFKNVCRHRASRLLDGQGQCERFLRCPYHGWAYNLDGSIRGIPDQTQFPDVAKEELSLFPVGLENVHGLLFVRLIDAPGPSVAEQFGDRLELLGAYNLEKYRKVSAPLEEIWPVNWKVAWDNYMENYHIPVGHPGLNRLLDTPEVEGELPSGVSYSLFPVSKQISSDPEEARYQQLLPCTDHRLPPKLQRGWLQFSLPHNLGLDLYPELLDTFQVIPLDVDQTLIRASFYAPTDCTADEVELQQLNLSINSKVNAEDRELCDRVQQGLQQPGYRPGPLSELESGIAFFHAEVRKTIRL